MTGPNGAGDRDPAGVFSRVRRDRQIANLLYGLLGAEDERDPQTALHSLAMSAGSTLDVCGPEYRSRVVKACTLLVGLVLDSAENATPIVITHSPLPAKRMLVESFEAPPGSTTQTANSDDWDLPPGALPAHLLHRSDGPRRNMPSDGTGADLTAEPPIPGVLGPQKPADGRAEPRKPHPFEPSPIHDAMCRRCGEPSGAVEHFQPTGLLNAPAGTITVALAPPDDVNPVTGHPLPPKRAERDMAAYENVTKRVHEGKISVNQARREMGLPAEQRYGGVDEEPGPDDPPCPTCGRGAFTDHAPTCADAD